VYDVFSDFLFVLPIALLLTIIFSSVFGHRRGFSGLGLFFILLMLATWAGGLWVEPFGPEFWGVKWLSFLVIGTFFALFLLAILPPTRKPETKEEAREQVEAEKETIIVLNVFFWIIVIGFLAAIIIAYL
jgi:branched-subunit amino acid transport protein